MLWDVIKYVKLYNYLKSRSLSTRYLYLLFLCYRHDDGTVKLDINSDGECRLSIEKAKNNNVGKWRCALSTQDETGSPKLDISEVTVSILG